MRAEKILLLMILPLLLGCISYQKEKEEVITPTYGLDVEVYGGNITIGKGGSFSLVLMVNNFGDSNATVEKIWLLGDVLYVEGRLNISPKETIEKGESRSFIFSGLKVQTTLGKRSLELYPAICYSYSTKASKSLFITSEEEIFEKYIENVQEASVTYSPITAKIIGGSVFLLSREDDRYVGFIPLSLQITSLSPNLWPVKSCDEISRFEISNLTLRITYPRDIEIEMLSKDPWEPKQEGETEVDNLVVKEYSLRDKYKKFLRTKQSLKEIPINIKVISESSVKLGEIKVEIDTNYYVYQMYPNKKTTLRVLEVK